MVRAKQKPTTTLIIVESPAKCNTIESYLGPGYKCVASFGHFRELATLKNIDIEHGFSLKYSIIETKLKQIEFISKLIKTADEVVLATDDDREGESIAWHICDYFKLNVATTKRIIFNEITQPALQHAIRNPTTVNMSIVNAQKARQVLDILVGFKITPMLWKCISAQYDTSLSAGRCQTPALRIIYDNQQEINASPGETVYNTVGYFTNHNIPFELNKQFTTEDEITDFLDGTADFSHSYTCSKPSKVVKPSPEPFTTSRLQQVASNELRFSPKETMKTCQTLYEGGFITYMRTDSTRYSEDFLTTAQEYILSVYDERYIKEGGGEQTKEVQTKEAQTKEAQTKEVQTKEAHEAIRVTKIVVKELPEGMGAREKRMYKLIWINTLASCMSDAVYSSVTATITGFQNTKYTKTSEQQIFAGFKAVKSDGKAVKADSKAVRKALEGDSKALESDGKDYQYLQSIDPSQPIQYKKVTCRQTIKNIKSHYTEARLVQLLEEKGIGRPSTFAMLVDKIQERGYVKKIDIEGREIDCKDFELADGEIYEETTKRTFGQEHGKLKIQPVGVIVSEFLDKRFADIFNYDYTREMELSLDKISRGENSMSSLCEQCNAQVDLLVGLLSNETKMEIRIDDNNTYLIGKYGPVIKCTEEVDGKKSTTFKKVMDGVDINTIENGNIDEIVNDAPKAASSYNLGKFDDEDVILKKGKYGLYITWGKNSKTLKDFGNRPMESITFQEIEPILNEGSNLVRMITSFLSIRKSAKGDYIFYKTPKMRKPSFHSLSGFEQDYKICKLDILKSWINEKYEIE
jgi:DNA topoisomerase I